MTAHRLGRKREVSRARLGRGADCVAYADVEWQNADGPGDLVVTHKSVV